MSEYGAMFDSLATRWANLENEHDLVHPDRGDCGGVGGCPIMRHGFDLTRHMIEALDVWRKRH